MNIGNVEHKTNIGFRNMDDFKSFINATDFGYHSEDVTSTVYVYKIYTPPFIVVKRGAYAKGTNYMQKTVENHG